jgi:F-type H+-transporting ATPase subunit gamma
VEELARIQSRLHSLEELDSLVGALRSMAASRAREAQEAFAGTRAYAAIVARAIAEVAPLARDWPADSRPSARILLVVTSENGFVGGFNNRLIDRALGLRRPGERLVLVGRRGQVAAAERDVTPDLCFAMASRMGGVAALARRIAAQLSDVTGARLVFAGYRPGAAFEIETRQVLPLEARPGAGDRPPAAPLHHLPPEALLAELAGEYLFAAIADALMQSLASENGARLRTMDAASRNIGTKLERLQRDERVARQEKTTSDMLDVVTGAEAVNHG